jgi:hypothetical protein
MTTEYKLGLTASGAEMIRDLLQIDVAALKRDHEQLTRTVAEVNTAVTRLGKHIESIEDVTLDLLTSCMRSNAEVSVASPEGADLDRVAALIRADEVRKAAQ